MAVIVDAAIWEWRGERWAHLVSDESFSELHEFAQRLGKRRIGFQGDHYDVDAADRCRALRMGAEPVDSRVLVARLRAAGLRRRGRHRTWRRIAHAPVAVPFDTAALAEFGTGGARMSAALSEIEPLVVSGEASAFADTRQIAVLLDFQRSADMDISGSADMAPPGALSPGELLSPGEFEALDVDELWICRPRRDGERSIELFVDRR